jgi:hypothetical protein
MPAARDGSHPDWWERLREHGAHADWWEETREPRRPRYATPAYFQQFRQKLEEMMKDDAPGEWPECEE